MKLIKRGSVPKVVVFLVQQSNGAFHISGVQRMHTLPIVASVGWRMGIFRDCFLKEMTLLSRVLKNEKDKHL